MRNWYWQLRPLWRRIITKRLYPVGNSLQWLQGEDESKKTTLQCIIITRRAITKVKTVPLKGATTTNTILLTKEDHHQPVKKKKKQLKRRILHIILGTTPATAYFRLSTHIHSGWTILLSESSFPSTMESFSFPIKDTKRVSIFKWFLYKEGTS